MPPYGEPPSVRLLAVPTKVTGWFVHVAGVALMFEIVGGYLSQHQHPALPADATVPAIFARLRGSSPPTPSGLQEETIV